MIDPDGITPRRLAAAIGGGGIAHNSLAGLQGGTTGEYYHFTSADYAARVLTTGSYSDPSWLTLTAAKVGAGTFPGASYTFTGGATFGGLISNVTSAASQNNTFVNYGTSGAQIILHQAGGTLGSPSATVLNSLLGGVAFRGYYTDGTPAFATTALIQAYAEEAYLSTARGSRLEFYTTTTGTASRLLRLAILGTGASDFHGNAVAMGALTATTVTASGNVVSTGASAAFRLYRRDTNVEAWDFLSNAGELLIEDAIHGYGLTVSAAGALAITAGLTATGATFGTPDIVPGSIVVYGGGGAGVQFSMSYDTTTPFLTMGVEQNTAYPWMGLNATQVGGGSNAQNYLRVSQVARLRFTESGDVLQIQVAGSGTVGTAITWLDALSFSNAAAASFHGQVTLATIGAFAGGDKYLVVDGSGHVHVSALGPLS